MSRRWITALLALVAALMAVPLVYIVSLSVRSRDDVLNGGLLPSTLFWRNWPDTFGSIDLPRHLANSWIVAAGGAALTLVIAVPAAYYTARARRGGERLLSLVLASYCAPPVVAVLPLFYLLRTAGLGNTLTGLALVTGLANVPVAVWLLDGFVRRVPREVEEAAWLDGLGSWGALRHVVVPLAAPGIVASGLICFFLGYNELLFALSFAQETSVQTLPVALSRFQGDRNIQFGQQAVASIVGVAPVYVLALLAQRRLVAGLSAGAVK
ncbi:ABC transporter permease [Actinomadura sp. NBRC 104425]|uniref:carbohydrate ABC transporter permease n=1 Tax=Actinomadura sp. NBRC 104425 TaxID=3032204 RepID=UPI0024A14628|nr:carbohydrate ABC transporter permease [Actinomadura sp. NBRC 104425]GLZ14592.1 ABC transporter permease [Actinomadura sp. NBRC 104425]